MAEEMSKSAKRYGGKEKSPRPRPLARRNRPPRK